MGNLKEGDQIIVTRVFSPSFLLHTPLIAKDLISSIHKVVQIDRSGALYPYRIEVEKSTFWVEGVPYSSLMMELV